MDKYYTPDISDLFVGYECEIWWNQNMLHEDEWYPISIGDNQTQDFDLIDFIGRIANSKLRTPYLTKDQIEKEGWEQPKPYNMGFLFLKGFNGFSWWELIWEDDEDRWIKIKKIKAFTKGREEDVRYDGPCPSINEFRKISKLLGI